MADSPTLAGAESRKRLVEGFLGLCREQSRTGYADNRIDRLAHVVREMIPLTNVEPASVRAPPAIGSVESTTEYIC